MKDFLSVLDRIGNDVQSAFKNHLDERDQTKVVGMGADGTATHALDKICEDEIIRGVEDLDIPVNIISEEAGFIDRGHSDNLVVDPLDGTFNAVHAIPFYSVSMAVMGKDFTTLSFGYIKSLNEGDIYYAQKGKGAFYNGSRINVSRERVGCSISKEGTHDDRMSRHIMELPGKHRRLGCASLEMCLVAKGSADLMAYVGKNNYVRNIDIAAGTLIVREAGGVVLDDSGSDLNMDLDVVPRKHVIAARNRKVVEEIL